MYECISFIIPAWSTCIYNCSCFYMLSYRTNILNYKFSHRNNILTFIYHSICIKTISNFEYIYMYTYPLKNYVLVYALQYHLFLIIMPYQNANTNPNPYPNHKPKQKWNIELHWKSKERYIWLMGMLNLLSV